MKEKESIPFAPHLVESMRSIGYSFETAIADLIDNSISANASKIEILFTPSENPQVIIFDNGCGMTETELEEALRYGSRNPLEIKNDNDLGRFGLGMKSASLSQCRKLIVASKKNDIHTRRLIQHYFYQNYNNHKFSDLFFEIENQLPKTAKAIRIIT